MFKKIEINNVGRFKSAKTEGSEQFFRKNTFIYGKNTFGKSTLTSIFKSLKDNKPDYIIGRKTIGAQKQVVKIIPEVTTPVGEYRYTTDENKWSAESKDIIIFDNHFVRESVYTQNQQIGLEQQKTIEAFMLGLKGAEYNIKIAELTEQIAENTRIQISTSNEYFRNRHLLGGLVFDTFLTITEIPDIDNEIEKNQRELDKVKNSELILSKLKSIKSLLENYKDFDTTSISEKLSVNSDLIANYFNTHINQEESKQSYINFLQTGSKMRVIGENEICPFCTQEIATESAKEFLKTIDLIYNEKYGNLQKAIKGAENLFPNETFSSEIEKVKMDLQQSGYILELDFSDIDILFPICKKSVLDKKDDLASAFNDTPFLAISEKAKNHINSIDADIIKFENPTDRKTEVEKILNELRANKERFSSWKERCGKYQKAKKDNEVLGSKKSTLWDEYLKYANGLSSSMLTDINTILGACNCDFTVQTFSFKGNQRQDLFVLGMNGNPISNNGSDNEMTIKNCLSDSDKWILALSLFLATAKNDSTVNIVVMDDPVSSFDSDRKRIILTEIKRILASTNKQLILLTHEKGFYHLIHAENGAENSSVFLKISLNTEGSDLVPCNPNEDPEFMSDYNCWIADMKNASSSQDLGFVKNAHACIRRVIEHVLKTKYPIEITKEINTVEAMLTKLEEKGGPYYVNSKRPEISAVLTNLTHHDSSANGQYPMSQLGIEDYKKVIRDSFQLIKNL